jgi:hypothetical protein
MKHRETVRICADCRYWHEDRFVDHHEREGQCRRHAPGPVAVPFDTCEETAGPFPIAYWPLTAHHDWCGDFKKRQIA